MNKKEYNRKYAKETYAWYKEHGICTRCHIEKAAPGRTTCNICAAIDRESAQEHYQKIRDKRMIYDKDRRSTLISEHRCTQCAAKLPDDWTIQLCPECRDRKNARARNKYARKHYRWL